MAYDPEYHRLYRERNRERIKERKRQAYQRDKEKIKARSRQWKINNLEHKRAIGRKYYALTREKRLAYMKERYQRTRAERISSMSAWRKANPEKYRNQYLKHYYGMTLAEYESRLSSQGGVCGICRVAQSGRLMVDHDHSTGAVRGLLCSRCNHGLGHFKDDPSRLLRAIEYLKETSSVSA